MLNAICNRKKLARTSKTPGRTQLINFFLVNDCISFVDIPGYGYASTSKKSQTHGTIWLLIISQAKEILFRCLLLLMLEEGLRSWMRK